MNENNEINENEESHDAIERRIRRLSRRSFLWGGVSVAGALGGLWMFNKYAPEDGGTKTLFRRTLRMNEAVARSVFFSPNHRSPEYPRAFASENVVNNYNGETPVVDLAAWHLRLEGASDTPNITLKDIQALPVVSQTTRLKCIEGWSVIVNWTGARFADFARQYPPPSDARYVALLSEPDGFPDERYYVGLDLESALHPQTLLAYQMNDQPLSAAHGAPLRLVIPHKYGVKNIKLITKIVYSTARPADYWAERGYDWYAGL